MATQPIDPIEEHIAQAMVDPKVVANLEEIEAAGERGSWRRPPTRNWAATSRTLGAGAEPAPGTAPRRLQAGTPTGERERSERWLENAGVDLMKSLSACSVYQKKESGIRRMRGVIGSKHLLPLTHQEPDGLPLSTEVLSATLIPDNETRKERTAW